MSATAPRQDRPVPSLHDHEGSEPEDPVDFGALAANLLARLEAIRACLLVSSDGMTLGVYPEDREPYIRGVWDRLRSVGDLQRGFIANGEEIWALARRGRYTTVAVAATRATPGLVLDRLESALRSAGEIRSLDGPSAASVETTGSPHGRDRKRGREVATPSERSPARPEEAASRASGPELSDPARAAQEFVARILGTGAARNGERPTGNLQEEPSEAPETVRDLRGEERAADPVALLGQGDPAAEWEIPSMTAPAEEASVTEPDVGTAEVDPAALIREFRDLADGADRWPPASLIWGK